MSKAIEITIDEIDEVYRWSTYIRNVDEKDPNRYWMNASSADSYEEALDQASAAAKRMLTKGPLSFF